MGDSSEGTASAGSAWERVRVEQQRLRGVYADSPPGPLAERVDRIAERLGVILDKRGVPLFTGFAEEGSFLPRKVPSLDTSEAEMPDAAAWERNHILAHLERQRGWFGSSAMLLNVVIDEIRMGKHLEPVEP